MALDQMTTTAAMTGRDWWVHFQARVGYKRMDHKVTPGLYKLGNPNDESPVLVTANYALSFDALRSKLEGVDCFILALDTKGVNVWCAAGKGTFGTSELIKKIEETGLSTVVKHRRLILPQLGAPGVSAHEVKKATGFTVEYGPVWAEDINEYLRTGKATAEMRMVKFPLKDRLVLAPMELIPSLRYLVPAMLLLFLAGGWFATLFALAAVLGGTVLIPILLPYIPTKDFSSKGMILGVLLSIPLSIWTAEKFPDRAAWSLIAFGIGLALLMAPVTGYLSLLFTGSTTYTSKTGVRKEIFRYMRVFVAMLIIGSILITIVAMNVTGWL
jgi:hypothetical protein